MLEEGELPAKTIAARAGFAIYEAMRNGFQNVLGVTPLEYRERFGLSRPATGRDASR